MKGRQGIVLEPQLPNKFRSGTESIQKLEENMYKREEILSDEEKPNPPRFTVELKVNFLLYIMDINSILYLISNTYIGCIGHSRSKICSF